MEYWQLDLAMLVLELVFSYATESLKILTDYTFGYELSLRFAEPFNFNPIHLVCTAGICIIVGWVCDSYVGKYYFVLIGVVSMMAAYICFIVGFCYDGQSVSKMTPFFILIYFTTSAARMLFILDQIDPNKLFKTLRRHIFYLVFVKLCGRALFLMLQSSASKTILTVHLYVALFFIVIYLLFLLSVGHKIHFEPVYFGICGKCFTNLREAKLHVQKLADQAKSEPSFIIVSDTAPKQGILKVKSTPEVAPVKELKFSTNVQVLEGQKYVNSYIESLAKDRLSGSVPRSNFIEPAKPDFKHFWGFRSISEQAGEDAADVGTPRIRPSKEKLEEPVEGKSSRWSRFLSKITPEYLYKKSVTTVGEKEDVIIKSWKGRKATYYVSHQTIRFLNILPMLIPGIAIGVLMFVVSQWTERQVLLVRRSPETILQYFETSTFALMMEIALFPFVEYIFMPIIRKIIRTDVSCLLFAYATLILSATAMMCLQAYLEGTIDFIPKPNRAQVRIFNHLETYSEINSFWTGTVHIFSKSFHTQSYVKVHSKRSKRPIKVINSVIELNRNDELELIAEETVSYIITENGFHRNSETDPSIFVSSALRNDIYSNYFIVSNDTSNITLHFQKHKSSLSTISAEKANKGTVFRIKPGLYTIYYIDADKVKHYFSEVHMTPGALYAMYLYKTMSHFDGNMYLMEDAVSIEYHDLLFHVFLGSVAQSVGSCIYYRFLYLESPSKMRTFTMSIILTGNLLGIALFGSQTFFKTMLTYSGILWVMILIAVMLFFTTVYTAKSYYYRYIE